MMRDALVTPELLNQLNGLFEPGEPLLDVGPRDAQGSLIQRLTGTDPEDDALRKHRPESTERLSDPRQGGT